MIETAADKTQRTIKPLPVPYGGRRWALGDGLRLEAYDFREGDVISFRIRDEEGHERWYVRLCAGCWWHRRPFAERVRDAVRDGLRKAKKARPKAIDIMSEVDRGLRIGGEPVTRWGVTYSEPPILRPAMDDEPPASEEP